MLIALISLRNPNFLTFTNFKDILLDISILAMVALAQGMIIITRGIDLSVASMLGLTAMMVSFVIKAYPETPTVLTVLLGMALGAVLGSLNGLIITVGRVPPIIATLGTLSIYRGLIFLYSNGTWINAFEMSPAFKQLAKGTPLGLPNLVITALHRRRRSSMSSSTTRSRAAISTRWAPIPTPPRFRAFAPCAPRSWCTSFPASCAGWPA